MNITTRDFGTLELDPKEIIVFRLPIYGFEQLSKFVILYDDSVSGPFSWLQSVEDATVCFILVDPQAVIPAYQPALSAEILRQLELKADEQCILRSIAVIPERFEHTTINLKSPIVINPRNKFAAQVILEMEYPVRARLLPEDGEEKTC